MQMQSAILAINQSLISDNAYRRSHMYWISFGHVICCQMTIGCKIPVCCLHNNSIGTEAGCAHLVDSTFGDTKAIAG